MLLQISEEERLVLSHLLSRALREVRDEISATETAGVMDMIKPRKELLRKLFERLESGAIQAQAGHGDSVP
jgi:hypothetical protein